MTNPLVSNRGEASRLYQDDDEIVAATAAAMRGASSTAEASSNDGLGHMKAAVRQEKMPKKNLNLRYDYFEYFVYSQCLPAWLMLLLRFLMGGVCISVFLYMSITQPFVNFGPSNSTTDDDNSTTKQPSVFKRHFYLCYLTIWSYLIITVYFVTALTNTLSMLVFSRRRSIIESIGDVDHTFSFTAGGFKSTENLMSSRGYVDDASAGDSTARRVGLRLQWLLCGVAANAALIVTLAYFVVLYPMIRKLRPGPISPADLLVHGFNSVFMFVEVVFSGVPVRLVHIIYTALYGLTYSLFSLIYWLPDHTNVIYPVLLNWNEAGFTIGMLCLLMFVGLPIVQLVWWLIYLARCFVAGSMLLNRNSSEWNPTGLNI